jgi:hypothetical protein
MPPSKRILWKRNGRAALRAKFDEATARLALSVQSIVNDPSVDQNEMLGRTFGQYLDHVNKLTKRKTSLADIAKLHEIFDVRHKNLDVSVSEADDDEGFENPDADDDDEGESDTGGESTDQLERAERAMKMENNMKSHSELMSDVVKKYGIVAFCKSVEQGDVRVSEHDLTKLIDEQAKRENTSFVKLFEAQDERGIVLRKAIAAARDAQFLSRTTTVSKAAAGMPGRATIEPRVTGGRAAQAIDNPKTALEELQSLVDQQRAQNPALSESEAWLRVYEHPDNRALALREREENRPTASWG